MLLLHAALRPRAVGITVPHPATVALTGGAVAVTGGAVTVPITARAAIAVTAVTATTTLTPRAAIAAADVGELLDALAGDLGIIGETQADSATLTIDLDDAHRDPDRPRA